MENNNALMKQLNQKIDYYLKHGEYDRADQACRELIRIQGLTPAEHMPADFPEKLKRKELETMHITKTSKRISGEDTITPISEEEGSSSTPWLSRKVRDETCEVWDSDDAVNWTKGYQTTRVTEYRYADYFTAAEDAGFAKLFQTNYAGNVFYYENEHLPDETDQAAGVGSETDYSITGEFSCGTGHFTVDQQKYRKSETGESAAASSMVITTTGETGNEREYLNAAGISFKLSDDTESGETRTTTMFTADSFEAVLQFTGMTEEEIHAVLDTIAP